MSDNRLDTLEHDLITMIVEEITLGVEVDADTDLLLTELVDSISVIRLVTWMEEYLDLAIDPVDVVLDNFPTGGRLVAYARRR